MIAEIIDGTTIAARLLDETSHGACMRPCTPSRCANCSGRARVWEVQGNSGCAKQVPSEPVRRVSCGHTVGVLQRRSGGGSPGRVLSRC